MRIIRYAFLAAVLAAATLLAVNPSLAGHGAKWGYEGDIGPEHWGDISHDYAACKEGKSQSPIDITGSKQMSLPAIETHYGDVPLKVINNGHAIQVNYTPGSTAVIGGKTYDLLQFHFHLPSENIVDGKPYNMEAHLVHKDKDGNLAVIGVFLTKGKKNEFIETLWNNIPDEVGKENAVEGVTINAASLLPGDGAYYHFTGSLTTPPCTEGVDWNVFSTPIEVSEEQLETFARFYEMNARPAQPLHGRLLEINK